MPLDYKRVHLAIADGLSGICAMCENFWEAANKGLGSCGQRCGGPISGGAFDKYRGPIIDFSNFCFVCLNQATHAVRTKNNPRVLGCCKQHIEIIAKYKPADKPAVDVVLHSGSESTVLSADEVIPDKISLRLTNEE